MVSLMLRVCKPIFGTGKAVVLDSIFFVSKGITKLESKFVYVGSLINKWRYWPKLVHEDLIDTHFQDSMVGDVDMLEAKTQENKTFRIFFMKELDCVMMMMASWIILDDIEGETITKKKNIFTY